MRKSKLQIYSGILFYTLLLCKPINLHAQLFAPLSSAGDTTQYSTFPVNDTIFVFNTPNNSGETVNGSLTAEYPSGDQLLTFGWSRFNTQSLSFDPLKTESNVATSSLEGLNDGCYRVRITDGAALDTVFRAWIYINHADSLHVEAEKNSQGKIKMFRYTCDYLDLNATASDDVFTYFDLATGDTLHLNKDFEILWTSDPETIIPHASERLEIRTYDPPPFNTTYTITITDPYGIEKSDNVIYESIVTKADFKIAVKGYFEKEFTESDLTGSAPLTAKFTNTSQNGVKFEWTFMDTLLPGHQDINLTTTDTLEEPEYKYYVPRSYYVKLVSTSNAGCIDSFSVESVDYPGPIIVEESVLEAPNFFTPNNDGYNDYFYVYNKSLKSFHMSIYSRTGSKVYEYYYNEADHADWKGWDGKVNGSNRSAPPGIYYYVVEAYGWDNKHYKIPDKVYKGFFHLFVGKENW
ncbi:MAG TPA: gliding motility-associated C-terminal domain-containing protein [Bacteroidales bacterium]|nr:gliding motility-associated C-terminal domain-containing protein [Bacteroidales bacterium]